MIYPREISFMELYVTALMNRLRLYIESLTNVFLPPFQDFPFINAPVTSADFESIMAYTGLTDEEKEDLLSNNYKALFGDKLHFS
jgi:hypothetical protein